MQIADLNFLVAEDDAFQRRWLVVMLTNLGAKNIAEVPDGLAALQILQKKNNKIDISFVDLDMPGMDGFELVRHLAKENHSVSVVLTSALDSSLLFSAETMSKAYGIDLLGTFEKPATPETLMALVALYKKPEVPPEADTGCPAMSIDEIRQALKDDEFEPRFQPKVDLATGQVKGVEAFARWCHPQHGVLRPIAFIPVLESNGEMNTFEWAIVEKCIEACRLWNDQGFPISVSINLSSSSLVKPGFAEKISEQALRCGVAEHQIILEVTEAATNSNVPYFLENLARLRMKGFGISVDDYGMGHSSMQELMQVPFTELKIDRSFVAGASQNQALEHVLSSSLEICRKLNRVSVAVGVETQHDWDFLRKLGCNYAQGYYIAKPMIGSAMVMWMQEWAHFF
jgi:EAL domain-containing protein (putative c-di-GMP-specific phosphodiesterase class I)